MTATRTMPTRRLLTGLVLMLLATMGMAAGVAPALGQEEADSSADADQEPVEVTESAIYAHPVTDASPETLTGSVPPQTVCLVFPDACPEELSPVTDSIEEGIGTTQEEAPVSPVHPIPPETIAVSYFTGKDRYESALKFELPDIPEGEEVTSFQLHLPVAQPSGDISSPAFREAMHAAFVFISDEDPAGFGERLAEALQEDPIAIDNDFLRMEACALTKPFEPSEAPQAQHRDEMPRDEPFSEDQELGPPAVDCLLGGTGNLDEDGEHWVFDLTFAADAWAANDAENHGVLISPAGVPNLAYGEPDHTTNAQVVMDHTEATATLETAEPPPPIEGFGDEPGADESDSQPSQPATPPETGDDLGQEPAPSAPSDGATGQQPEVADTPEAGDEPASSEPVDEPGVASPETEQATPAASPSPAPWTWLLVPVFAGGAWLVTRALTAPVTAAAGGGGGGAMSRLIATRGGATPA